MGKTKTKKSKMTKVSRPSKNVRNGKGSKKNKTVKRRNFKKRNSLKMRGGAALRIAFTNPFAVIGLGLIYKTGIHKFFNDDTQNELKNIDYLDEYFFGPEDGHEHGHKEATGKKIEEYINRHKNDIKTTLRELNVPEDVVDLDELDPTKLERQLYKLSNKKRQRQRQ